MASTLHTLPAERIIRSIRVLRGQKILLDADLADLFGVDTRTLVQAVARSLERFPDDFMFRLADEEFESVKRTETARKGRGGRRSAPYAFTEQGVAMLSSVLKSPEAVQVNIAIMRAFVELRQIIGEHRTLVRRIDELEQKYDHHFKVVFDAIRELMTPPESPARKPIGFQTEGEERGKKGQRIPRMARRSLRKKK